MSTPAPMRPLSGVRVLDLSRLLPGPFCTMILSDLGAQVDKLEDPQVGDYLRLFPPLVGVGSAGGTWDVSARFASINRDKRSLSLDLKNATARQAFLRMLPRYDVLVESFRPGVLDRLGLSLAVLHQHNPRLVVCSITGYGQQGPYRDHAGHDLNYVALAGVLGLCGANESDPPHVMPIQLADLGAGALWPAVQILGALRVAEKTGQGSHLDVSMCEGALSFLIPDLCNRAAGGPPPRRGNELLTGAKACYGVYRTADDRFLAVGALEPKFWIAFNTAIGRTPDPADLVDDDARQASVRAEVQAILRGRTREAWMAHFSALGTDVCVEPVLELDELPTHPLHAARDVFFSIQPAPEAPAGLAGDSVGQRRVPPVPQVRTPALPASAIGSVRPPPQLGEHTRRILQEGGLSDAEIDQLVACGAARAAAGSPA